MVSSILRDLGAAHFLLIIPLMGCFLSLLISRLSGWSRLASVFRDNPTLVSDESFETEIASFRTGSFGPVTYHSCLRFQTRSDGLRISIAFPFRLGHPPLFIPWEQVHHVRQDPKRYSRNVIVSIGNPTLARTTLPAWVRYRMPIEMRPRKQ
ncbi:MAG: hypothetical protein AB8B91_22095 [Rubripirellula sp.]